MRTSRYATRYLKRAALAALLCINAWPAHALTLNTSFLPLFADDELAGCSINFVTTQADHATKDGALSLVTGSISLWLRDRGAVYMLKLGVSGPEGYDRPSPPSSAALRHRFSTNAVDRLSAEHTSPGFLTTIFAANKATNDAFFSSLSEHRLEGIYSLTEGGLGVPFTVDLQVAETNLTTEVVTPGRVGEDFIDCIDALLEAEAPQ